MKALTPKQERFVKELVAGKSQRAAYRAAYDCEKSSDRTVDRKASLLYCRDDIRTRYEELIAEAAKGAVYDRQRMIADLTEIVDIGLTHIRLTREHKANFTEKNSREIADLPRGATTVIAAIDKLDKLLKISETGDGTGEPVLIDDFAEPEGQS